MNVILTLIPSMLFLGICLLGLLIWSARNGQYDDLDGDAERILLDEDLDDR